MDIGLETQKKIKEGGLESLGRFYASYRGFIADYEDPEFLGRVKLKVPQIYEEEVLDYWAWSKGMYCGTGIGLFAIPNVGDMVWVSFEGGDPRFPIWEYGHFAKPNGQSDVPADWQTNGNKPTLNVWQSSAGHRIEMENKAGSEQIKIINKDGIFIVLDSNGIGLDAATGKVINIGTAAGAAEPAVLGNKNEGVLNDILTLLQDILNLLSAIASGDSATAGTLGLTYPTVITAALSQLGVDISKLQTDIPATKSAKINVD